MRNSAPGDDAARPTLCWRSDILVFGRASLAPRLASAVPFLLSVALGIPTAAGPATAAALQTDTRCKKPAATAKLVYAKNKIGYGLEKLPEYREERRGKLLGLFWADARVRRQVTIEGGCLVGVDLSVEVEPHIELKSTLKKKFNRCTRQATLDHEKRHGQVARKHYKRLPAKIEAMTVRLFTGKRVPDFETFESRFEPELEKVMKRFNRKYAAAQQGFHDELAEARIIRKKCSLKKRK